MSQWSKEECERRFIQGEKITLPALSKASTVKLSTLKTWSTKGQWIAKRETFRAELAVATHEKTIDALSTKLADLEITHATAYATIRDCAMAKVNALKVRIDLVAKQAKLMPGIATESLGDEAVQSERQAQATAQGDAIRDSDVLDLQALTNVVDKCIRGERMVLGAEYEDLNKAVAAIVRAGLEVKVPDDRVVAKYRSTES
jgi:hypothetical protein